MELNYSFKAVLNLHVPQAVTMDLKFYDEHHLLQYRKYYPMVLLIKNRKRTR